MKEYVKLSVTLKERLLFLFTGLLKKEYIISRTIEPTRSIPTVIEEEVVNDTKEDKPLEVGIPFFELDESETKSNLNE